MTENIADQLKALAAQLHGQGWNHKYPDEWTPAERAAYERTDAATFFAWIEAMWGERDAA